MIPIEIVNKILVYVGDLNNNVIITQYYPVTNKEYYTINFNSNVLLKIQAVYIMKRISPIYDCDYLCNNYNRRLYQSGMAHYEEILRIGKK